MIKQRLSNAVARAVQRGSSREALLAVTALLAHVLSEEEGGVAPDRLLTVAEAATRLQTSRDWLYRHARRLPFARRLGRQVRFSERALEAWLQAGARGGACEHD